MAYFMVYASLYSLPIVFINGIFAIALLWHAKTTGFAESRRDGLFLACAYLVSAIVTPLILTGAGTTDAGQDFLFFIGSLFFGSVLGILLVIVGRNFLISKKNPSSKKDLTYDQFLRELPTGDDTRRDYSRKILHIVISVSPIIMYAIAYSADAYFKSINILQEYGVSGLGAGRGVNILIYWGFSYMISMQDLYRFNAFYCLPGWGRRWLRYSLEKKEHRTFVAAVPFLLGHVPFLMAPFAVFFSMTFVASIGDASSSVFGKRFGKHHLSHNQKKTWEGLVAGMIVSFVAVIIVNLYLNPANIMLALGMAAILASVYGIFDARVTRVDDNLLNTYFLGAIAWISYIVLSLI